MRRTDDRTAGQLSSSSAEAQGGRNRASGSFGRARTAKMPSGVWARRRACGSHPAHTAESRGR
eukprot:166561-Prymnesium_polylepis.1